MGVQTSLTQYAFSTLGFQLVHVLHGGAGLRLVSLRYGGPLERGEPGVGGCESSSSVCYIITWSLSETSCPRKSDTCSVFLIRLHRVGHAHHAQSNIKLKPCCLVSAALCDRFCLSCKTTCLIAQDCTCPVLPSLPSPFLSASLISSYSEWL